MIPSTSPSSASQAFRIAAFQQSMQKDVVGLEHGVGFELAAPVAFRMLAREDVVGGSLNRGLNICEGKVTCEPVASAHGLPYTAPEEVLNTH